MSSKVTFDYSKAMTCIKDHEIESMKGIVENAKNVLVSGTGAGNDYIGWVNLPVDYDKEEFARIQKAAQKIQNDSEVLIVIGIGGSTWEQGLPSSSCATASTTWFPKRSARPLRSTMPETASAAPISGT